MTSEVLTNAHTHLELAGLARLCPAEPVSFEKWLARLAWRGRLRTRAQIRVDVELGIESLIGYGATHVGDITATGLSIEPLLSSGLRGVVFLEVLGLGRKDALARLQRAQAAIERARRHLRHGRVEVGLSLHAPYSCHPTLLRDGAAWCVDRCVPLCVHVAESPAETDLLLNGQFPSLPRWARALARLLHVIPDQTPGMRPLAYLGSLGVLAARPLLVHGVHVTAQEVQAIADAGCAVAHCPRSNHLLSCGRMPLERYLEAGVPLYLGTDSLASSPSLDVREEAAFAETLHAGRVAPEEISALLHRPLGGRD